MPLVGGGVEMESELLLYIHVIFITYLINYFLELSNTIKYVWNPILFF